MVQICTFCKVRFDGEYTDTFCKECQKKYIMWLMQRDELADDYETQRQFIKDMKENEKDDNLFNPLMGE